MKRMMMAHNTVASDARLQPVCTLPPGASWIGMTLPPVPSAEWPASLTLDYAIDRLVRDALSTGRSIQEIIVDIVATAQSLSLHLTESDIDQRIHAQLVANT